VPRATPRTSARRASSTGKTDRARKGARAVSRSADTARRAIIEDIREEKRSWLQHGVAALAVSVLGLGVAASVVLTGSAQHTTANVAEPKVQISLQPGVTQPSAFERDPDSTSRSGSRESMDPALVNSLAEQRIEALTRVDKQVDLAARSKALKAREKALESDSESTRRQAALLAARQAGGTNGTGSLTATFTGLTSNGKACLPVVSGYTLAARFGQVGAWARYHTGLDFSAPVGTPIHAPISGVVTNAGIGPASGWAGNYVAIRYADGTQSLMAHMSTVSVSVGQTVLPCQLVGAIGMTGRTFGPHVHFEIYPAGITPGDVYKAVNPEPWLRNLGLMP
jgi:murein DD-endopeptidase MepM/ murein hydrolase activator NlpD